MRYLRNHLRQLLIGISILIFSVMLFLYGYIFWDLPSISQIDAGLALPSTRIYDRHGALLYEILPPEQGRNRVISLDEMPDVCINAIIAVEDANYWSHPGIDPQGIARAFWINMSGGEVMQVAVPSPSKPPVYFCSIVKNGQRAQFGVNYVR